MAATLVEISENSCRAWSMRAICAHVLVWISISSFNSIVYNMWNSGHWVFNVFNLSAIYFVYKFMASITHPMAMIFRPFKARTGIARDLRRRNAEDGITCDDRSVKRLCVSETRIWTQCQRKKTLFSILTIAGANIEGLFQGSVM